MENQENQNKSLAPWIIAIAVIAIVVVGLGGFYLGKTTVKAPRVIVQNDQATTTQATTTIPHVTKEEAAQWKTYTFSGITFRYPVDWKAEAGYYYTPAGAGGQDSVIFSPINIDIKSGSEQKITVGGHQTTCDNLGKDYQCKTVFDIPVYTKSTDLAVLRVLGALAAHAVNNNEIGWKMYTNTALNYQIGYPKELVIRQNASYPAFGMSGIKGTVFAFPKSYYQGGTISEANIGIAATKTSCSVMADGSAWRAEVQMVTRGGFPFTIRKATDAAAGNYYTSTEYSVSKGGQCYRIGLLIHGTNPGNTYVDKATIDSITALNNKVAANLEAILEQMVGTLSFI